MEAVILRQSVQLQMNVSTKPGFSVGNASWTAPQKQVAVASSSLDQPSVARLARGMYGFDLSEAATDGTCFCIASRRAFVFDAIAIVVKGEELVGATGQMILVIVATYCSKIFVVSRGKSLCEE
jgi:hypothetical protein